MIQQKSTKTKDESFLIWIVLPIGSNTWVPSILEALSCLETKLERVGVKIGSQLLPAEMVLPWQRSKPNMRSMAASVFMTQNLSEKISSLVVLDVKVQEETFQEEGEVFSENEQRTQDTSIIHIACTYTDDKEWIIVCWTDESGIQLTCKVKAQPVLLISIKILGVQDNTGPQYRHKNLIEGIHTS